ncbi:DUF3606 domain-containing protein [Rhodanobacter sp. UC4450_H17]
MDERIDLRSPLSRAHWCGNFSCSDAELLAAVRATHSTDVGTVGLYLATRHALEDFDQPTARGSATG